MAKESGAQNTLEVTISTYGFTPVKFWRSSLRPFSILESAEGKQRHEVPGLFGDMFESIALPQPATSEAVEFAERQDSAGGFKIGVNLLGELLGAIGGKIGLGASARRIRECLFEFKGTSVTHVAVDLITIACRGAVPSKAVLERIESEHLQRFVVIRTLQAKSIVFTALGKKGAKVGLDLGLANLPVTGDVKAEMNKSGGIVLGNPAGKALVFGIDYYDIKPMGGKVTIGSSQTDNAPPMRMLTYRDFATPQPVRRLAAKRLVLGERVTPVPEFVDIGAGPAN